MHDRRTMSSFSFLVRLTFWNCISCLSTYSQWRLMVSTILLARDKGDSKDWRHSSPPKPKMFRTTPLVGKLMLTLFEGYKGLILEHYTTRETTIKSKGYCDQLGSHWNRQSGQNVAVCSVLTCSSSMITGGLAQHVKQVSKLQICVWSVFHI